MAGRTGLAFLKASALLVLLLLVVGERLERVLGISPKRSIGLGGGRALDELIRDVLREVDDAADDFLGLDRGVSFPPKLTPNPMSAEEEEEELRLRLRFFLVFLTALGGSG